MLIRDSANLVQTPRHGDQNRVSARPTATTKNGGSWTAPIGGCIRIAACPF